ncbi:hypothetical protein [Bradyrhizobium sp. sGM-13]|uniref:hypothetical protein n=1 Tax=Bradyrhizobium sp. sGM-13 TaxID=2831781 RepID=UPI001BCD7272|nr:hypothetical protein [Bradyrhizobium sp. sGM-13]
MAASTVDLIAKLAGPAATVLAALTAAGVAIAFGLYQAKMSKRQADIAQDKLALDLFQRRLETFSTVRRAIAKIISHGASDPAIEADLLEGIDAARWLFGPNIRKYLDSLYNHALDLDVCNKELKEPHLIPSDRAAILARRREHFNQLENFYKRIDELFGPYLSVTHEFSR